MRRVGQARRRDANEADIVDALRQVGANVTPISGRGAPDILVRFQGRLYGFEIKGATGKRTEAQQDTQWQIVRSVDEVMKALGVRV